MKNLVIETYLYIPFIRFFSFHFHLNFKILKRKSNAQLGAQESLIEACRIKDDESGKLKLKQSDIGIPILDIRILEMRLRTNNNTKSRLKPDSKHPLSFSFSITTLLIILYNFLFFSLYLQVSQEKRMKIINRVDSE